MFWTLMPSPQGRPSPSHPPRRSRWWRQESRKSPWCRLCSRPPTCLSAIHCSTPAWVATFGPRCLRQKKLFQVRPSFLWCLGVPDMAEQLVTDTRHEAVHYPACHLFRSQKVPMRCIRHYVISSIDITPVTMPEQILVHLVRPRCVVASIELLRRERASHSSVHFFFSFFLLFFTRD